ncbi:hypothetical protein LOK49_LG03G02765 [Camellia lanceoleosa]|uniref:Uncharacterized protein n=1 Tax=Camellia lanceoleosa TaxID=1840588 RepID=A0ACC0IEK3_9ERIC|nr:hypothetical protein LOK49_LG03G02765 [Camellia lanceoleosa]
MGFPFLTLFLGLVVEQEAFAEFGAAVIKDTKHFQRLEQFGHLAKPFFITLLIISKDWDSIGTRDMSPQSPGLLRS